MFLVIDWVWQFLLQEDKQRMCVFAIDCDFTEQIDLGHEPVPRPYILQGIENLTVIAVLLVTELIAGKTQNSEPLLTVLIHKLVHLKNKQIYLKTNEREKAHSADHLLNYDGNVGVGEFNALVRPQIPYVVLNSSS